MILWMAKWLSRHLNHGREAAVSTCGDTKLKEYPKIKGSRKSSFSTLFEVAVYPWHLSMCYFLGPLLCFWIQMVVPKGAPSPLITWDGKKESLSFKIHSGGQLSPRPVAVASPLRRRDAVYLFLMKVLNGPRSLFFENLVMCLSRWWVCIWAWNLAYCWHDHAISRDLFG